MKKKLYIIVLLFFAFNGLLNAQNTWYKHFNQLKKYRYSKHLDSSKFYFKKALPIVLKNKDSIKIFYVYKHLGDAYEHHQFLDSTLMMYDICKKYIPKNNYAMQSFLLNDTAYTYDLLHDYDKSTQLTLQALNLAEKSGDNDEVAMVSITVADGFSKLKMNYQAEQYYKKSIQLGGLSKRAGILDQAYRHYGIHLLKNHKLESAFKNLKLANKYAYFIKDSISIAYSWYHLSDYYWKKNQIDSSFILAKKAEKIWERRAENRDLMDVYLFQGKNYLRLNKLTDAEVYLKKAEKLISKDLYFNNQLYSTLSELYNKKGNSKLAFDYLLKSKKCIEQINENENKSRVTSLKIKFETDKNEILIQQEKKKNELAALNASQKEIEFKTVSIILFFVIISLAVIAIAYSKIKRNNKLLKKSNDELERLALQKKLLLREVHHRVKNNLTTLKSLLFLQAKSSNNEEAKLILKECQNRIDSMALIHQNLYEDGESDQVHFYKFIKELFTSLEASYSIKDKNIEIELVENSISVDISLAIPLGIILNELATNSFKYAFDNTSFGVIYLQMEQLNNTLKVVYYDNGKGVLDGFNTDSNGFGFKLIQILTQQINGEIYYEYKNNLSEFTILINGIN